VNLPPGTLVRLSEYFYDDILKGRKYARIYHNTKPSDQTHFYMDTGSVGIFLERLETGKNFKWCRVLFPGGVGWVDSHSLEEVE